MIPIYLPMHHTRGSLDEILEERDEQEQDRPGGYPRIKVI